MAEDEFLTTEQIVERFPVLGSRWKVVQMRKDGTGPPPVWVKGNVFYKPEQVQAWLDNGGTVQR